MKTYFFKTGNQPAQAFDVNLDGLLTDDAINIYTLQKQAEHLAKFLAYLHGVPVRFWRKDTPENTVVIEYMPEHLDKVAV